jgi:hypothetical protein
MIKELNTSDDELCNLYSLPIIDRVIKLKIRWVYHVRCMEKLNMHTKIVILKPGGKRYKFGDNPYMGR